MEKRAYWPCLRAIMVLIGLAAIQAQVHADVFQLKDGRVVAGKIQNRSTGTIDDKETTVWTVEVEPGAYVRVYDSELVRGGHREAPSAIEEYLEKLKDLPQSADAHFALSGWCKSNGLRELATAHLFRAIDLDPDHGPARANAGYRQDQDGRWVKQEVIMEGLRGKVQYKGRWRFPESVAIEEARQQAKEQQVKVTANIWRWHKDVVAGSGSRREQGLIELRSVADPAAVEILTELLLDTRKPSLQRPTPVALKLLYVKLLSQFSSPQASRALTETYLKASDSALRNAAMDVLRSNGRETAIPILINYLENANNRLVNRAAQGLGELSAKRAILPLIEALITQHKRVVGGGNSNYSVQGGMTFGNSQKTVVEEIQNSDVLSTLNQLTGQGDLGYSRNRWLSWYASVHAPPADDLRRDS